MSGSKGLAGAEGEVVAAAAWWALASSRASQNGQEAWSQFVALVREHPYVTAAVVAAAAAGGWAAYESYIGGPTRRHRHHLEKRRRRVNADKPFGLGFKNCPEVVYFIFYFFIFTIYLSTN